MSAACADIALMTTEAAARPRHRERFIEIFPTLKTNRPTLGNHRCGDFVKLNFIHGYAAFTQTSRARKNRHQTAKHLPQLKIGWDIQSIALAFAETSSKTNATDSEKLHG